MHYIEQSQAVRVVGLELRTSNAEAASTIPAFWQHVGRQGLIAQVQGLLAAWKGQPAPIEVFAVYTHFEHAGVDNDGLYSLIVGIQVPADFPLPANMVHAVLPACRRAVFPVPNNDPQQVGAAWMTAWQASDLPKAYVADCERYGADGRIEIWVGLK